jgi:transcriptional regulator with XRE-family HTH domain
MADYAEDVGRRIREARENNRPDLSQEDLAHELGVTGKTVGRWERGESQPRGRQWEPLAKLLQVEVGDLRGQPPAVPAEDVTETLARIESKLDRLMAVIGLDDETADLNSAVDAFARALEARAEDDEAAASAG